MAPENYENVIVGSGEGGKYLAWHLAQLGQRTCVVERRWIGGSCPNVNCLPSKNEIWSAKVADLVHHAANFGTIVSSSSTDMAAVLQRKRDMVEGLIATNLERYRASGAELIMGEATVAAGNVIEVRLNSGGRRTLAAQRLFLNLGTHASIPAVPGLAECAPLTNIEALELHRLPEHLVVIGGGYVGLEFAQAYRRFGSRVTVLQQDAQLLSAADPGVAAEILQIFANEGIDVLLSAQITRVEGHSGEQVSLAVRTPAGSQTIAASDILVATGRLPNTGGIGLESAGIALDANGYIQVNDRLETTAPSVWAIGECAGSPQFTHASFDDFRIVRDNLAGRNHGKRDRVIPYCLFTDPPLAHIGLTEKEARQRGIAVHVAQMPAAAVLRTRTTGETRGFLKALIDPADSRILGFTMIGSDAGEVMAIVQTAMLAGLPYTALRDAIFTHPTMAEGLVFLFAGVKQPAASASAPPIDSPARHSAHSSASASDVPLTTIHRVNAGGVNVFYRQAGPPDAPVVLLLHGFPASSFQYRHLIPRLAQRYRVIAPDLPGFGFTEVPPELNYKCSFDALARTIAAFTDALRLDRYALYVFDYGAPTGFRLAMAHPERVTAIVSQNGNAYEEGLGGAWAPIRRYWNQPSPVNREALRPALTPEGIRREYSVGMPDSQVIAPEGYTLDAAIMALPGHQDIQLDLFLDYAGNVQLYPAFQEYFRKYTPPLLAIWGKLDPYFIPAGAEAFRRDNPNATVQFLDTGHFALETHVDEIAHAMKEFLAKHLSPAKSVTA